MTQTLEKREIVVASGIWVALISNPKPIQPIVSQEDLRELREMGIEPIENKTRFPALRTFQLLDPFSIIPNYIAFRVHPGSQVGYHVRQPSGQDSILRLPIEYVNEIRKNPINAEFFQTGEIEIIETDRVDSGEPGYRHFSEENAIKLVKSHAHESWIERALVRETRPKIIELAKKQIKKLTSQKEKARQNTNMQYR